MEGEEREVKFGYLLLIEYDNYLIISKKNISGLDKLINEYIDDLDYMTISRLFISDHTRFEKFSMHNMDVSDTVIRRRQVEALNLKNVLSTLGANKYILSGMRINEMNKRIAIAFNTSKINRLGQRVSLVQFFEFVTHVVDKLTAFNMQGSYLDSFSTPLSFEDNFSALQPTSILFNFNDLFQDPPDEAFFLYKGEQVPIEIIELINDFDRFCSIRIDTVNNRTIFKVKNKRARDLSLRIGRKGITLISNKLKKTILKFGEEEIDLLTYVNKNQNFIITFADVETVYWSRKLFKDSRLMGNVDYLLSVLKPNASLSTIGTEKGVFSAASTEFDRNSIFGFIENHYFDECDYIICDDLGDEWADYISIKDYDNIRFYHAKSDTLALSASKFHEVVAQAQKNLGNIFATDVMLHRKSDKWMTKYATSNIDRLRKGPSVAESVNAYKRTLYSPNTRKEVFIVVNFISKGRLGAELTRLAAGQMVEHQVIQILWLLSSLVSSCKEANTDVYIVCQP